MTEKRLDSEQSVIGFYIGCPDCSEPILNWRVEQSWRGVGPFQFSELERFYGFCYTCNHWVWADYAAKPYQESKMRCRADYKLTTAKSATFWIDHG